MSFKIDENVIMWVAPNFLIFVSALHSNRAQIVFLSLWFYSLLHLSPLLKQSTDPTASVQEVEVTESKEDWTEATSNRGSKRWALWKWLGNSKWEWIAKCVFEWEGIEFERTIRSSRIKRWSGISKEFKRASTTPFNPLVGLAHAGPVPMNMTLSPSIGSSSCTLANKHGYSPQDQAVYDLYLELFSRPCHVLGKFISIFKTDR